MRSRMQNRPLLLMVWLVLSVLLDTTIVPPSCWQASAAAAASVAALDRIRRTDYFSSSSSSSHHPQGPWPQRLHAQHNQHQQWWGSPNSLLVRQLGVLRRSTTTAGPLSSWRLLHRPCSTAGSSSSSRIHRDNNHNRSRRRRWDSGSGAVSYQQQQQQYDGTTTTPSTQLVVSADHTVTTSTDAADADYNYDNLTWLGWGIAATAEIGLTVLMEYCSGFFGGYFLGSLTDIPRFCDNPHPPPHHRRCAGGTNWRDGLCGPMARPSSGGATGQEFRPRLVDWTWP